MGVSLRTGITLRVGIKFIIDTSDTTENGGLVCELVRFGAGTVDFAGPYCGHGGDGDTGDCIRLLRFV